MRIAPPTRHVITAMRFLHSNTASSTGSRPRLEPFLVFFIFPPFSHHPLEIRLAPPELHAFPLHAPLRITQILSHNQRGLREGTWRVRSVPGGRAVQAERVLTLWAMSISCPTVVGRMRDCFGDRRKRWGRWSGLAYVS